MKKFFLFGMILSLTVSSFAQSGSNRAVTLRQFESHTNTVNETLLQLQTQRIDKVWSTATKWMDGNGVFYEVETVLYNTLTAVESDYLPEVLGHVWVENQPVAFPNYYWNITNPAIDPITYNKDDSGRYEFVYADKGVEFRSDAISPTATYFLMENNTAGGSPGIQIQKQLAGTFTNVLDSVVTTNSATFRDMQTRVDAVESVFEEATSLLDVDPENDYDIDIRNKLKATVDLLKSLTP